MTTDPVRATSEASRVELMCQSLEREIQERKNSGSLSVPVNFGELRILINAARALAGEKGGRRVENNV